MIYRCPDGHISFARELRYCGMKGCSKQIEVVSKADLEWLYKISPDGLAMNEKDLRKVLGDKDMPKEVKDGLKEAFPELKKRRFWF